MSDGLRGIKTAAQAVDYLKTFVDSQLGDTKMAPGLTMDGKQGMKLITPAEEKALAALMTNLVDKLDAPERAAFYRQARDLMGEYQSRFAESGGPDVHAFNRSIDRLDAAFQRSSSSSGVQLHKTNR